MRQAAILIKCDGTATGIVPVNGRDFSLEELQGMVEGLIEIVPLTENVIMVVNEEGLIKGLPANLTGCLLYGTPTHGSPIVGNIVIMKEGWTDEGMDLLGLTDEEITVITQELVALFERAGKAKKGAKRK